MICAICKSSAFTESQQGFLFCQDCGTQNEELFAESFENEDATMSAAFGGKNIIKNYVKADKVAPTDATPLELSDVLFVFQSILKLYVKATAQISGVHDILRVVKMLWFKYLEKWNEVGGRMMANIAPPSAPKTKTKGGDKDKDGDAKQKQTENEQEKEEVKDKTSKENDPLYMQSPKGASVVILVPSRLLLLGLVNLACRLCRAWVTPLDLLRWCRQGSIPYAKAFECLPADIRSRVLANSSIHKYFVRDFTGNGRIQSITPSNILFHTSELGRMLEIPIPPLNAPLVARAMHLSLALPESVVKAHARVVQLMNVSLAQRSHRFNHNTEDILASIFMACKLDPTWLEWAVVRAHHHIAATDPYEADIETNMDTAASGKDHEIYSKADFFDLLIKATSSNAGTSDNNATPAAGAVGVGGKDAAAAVGLDQIQATATADSITPRTLDAFLLQTCQILRSTMDSANPIGNIGYASFNKIVHRSLLLQPALLGLGPGSTASQSQSLSQPLSQSQSYMGNSSYSDSNGNDSIRSTAYSDKVRLSHIELFSPFGNDFAAHVKTMCPHPEPHTQKKRKRAGAASGTERDEEQEGYDISSYLSSVGVCGDQAGATSLPHLCLLERLARYHQCSPALLNAVLEQHDHQIMRVATDALTMFTKSAALDCHTQSKQERSMYRGGGSSLVSSPEGKMRMEASSAIREASKINYMKNSLNMIRRFASDPAKSEVETATAPSSSFSPATGSNSSTSEGAPALASASMDALNSVHDDQHPNTAAATGATKKRGRPPQPHSNSNSKKRSSRKKKTVDFGGPCVFSGMHEV